MKPIAQNTLIQNRYLIVHLIGKGGMGEVYLAVDQRLGSAIALKRTFFSDDAMLGHAFEREARTLARLRHPVLPKVSDHFTESDTQFLVMEHISGDDLSKRLENLEQNFPISWVLFWADQLLDALNYLHSHEPPIIHRDIKPQNLKLTDENHIVLLDFGLSKNSSGETRAASATSGSIVGYTPHYAPMEQIRGTGTDARSDIYSLSATLYQILTRTVPPDALSRADSLINGLGDPVTPISDLNPEVSKAVSDVIIKGMSLSQEQRYKTARQMQKALRDAYAQLQSDMSAHTIAFTVENPATLPQSPQQTAELSGSPSISQPGGQQPLSAPTNSPIASANVNEYNSQPQNDGKTVPDFDATIRYDPEDSSSLSNSLPKQSAIKTEVFLAGSSSAITAAQSGNLTPNDSFPTNDYNQNRTFAENENSAQENFESPKNFSPDATIPLISFDSQANQSGQAETSAGFDSLSERSENKTSAGATFVPPPENSAPSVETFVPAAIVSPTPKKSSGKGLAVAGGLAALLILATAVAGLGWYFMRDSGTTKLAAPSPTPEATVAASPSVEPTIEVTTMNTNTSTNTDANSSNTNSVLATNTPKPDVTKSGQTVQPTPIRVTTPKPIAPEKTDVGSARPIKTPAPAKTPKSVPTDILQ